MTKLERRWFKVRGGAVLWLQHQTDLGVSLAGATTQEAWQGGTQETANHSASRKASSRMHFGGMGHWCLPIIWAKMFIFRYFSHKTWANDAQKYHMSRLSLVRSYNWSIPIHLLFSSLFLHLEYSGISCAWDASTYMNVEFPMVLWEYLVDIFISCLTYSYHAIHHPFVQRFNLSESYALPSGSIEVSNTSAKTAKQINVIAEDGSSDDDAAAQGFEAASKKLRISAVSKDDEIILTLWLQYLSGWSRCLIKQWQLTIWYDITFTFPSLDAIWTVR